MAFDLNSAQPVEKKSSGGFDISSAQPVSNQGGAAFVSPRQRATPSTPEQKERVRSLSQSAGEYLFGEPEREELSGGEIAGAGGFGAVAGLGAPKVLEKGGSFVKKLPLPYAKPIGSAAEALGIAAGKIPALERAWKGGLGGAAGSTAEQTAEIAGAPKAVSLPVGVVTGGVVPELETAIKKLVTKAGSLAFGSEGMTSAIMRDLKSQGVEITPKVAELIEKEVKAFRQAPKGKDPQEALYKALRTGATDITGQAAQDASTIRRAGAEAVKEAERKAAKMAAAAGKTTDIGAAAGKEAEAARANIGQDREPSDIGKSLRDRIVNLFGDITQKRSAEYTAQKAVRDAVVKEKEAAGQLVKDMPEYDELLTDLRNKLLIGKKAQEQKTAPVTEKGVLQAYQNIYDAVNNRKVMIGVDQNGNPAYKTFPTSFDALDDVRRRLGDVAFGKDVEGYSAIGANIAKDFYSKISNLQSKYAGESHDALQSGYEMASRLLDKYKSRAGKQATAADRFDPTRFSTDPASLPNNYFSSKQSVNDLIELTGNDRAFVNQAASDFTARQLRNKDLKGVQRWADSNSDWLNALPEVKAKVDAYAKALERGERIAGKSKAAAKILETRQPQTTREGERMAQTAEQQAGKITKQGEDRANLILGSQFPNEEIEKLMLSGDVARWNEVAPILARSPEGQQNIEAAVRQVMSRQSPRSMGDTFRDNVRQRLETTGLMTPDKLDKIQTELDYISGLTITPEQKMTLMQRLIRNAFTTTGATAVGAPVGGFIGDQMEE
jgi:hypothetical protein